MDNNDKERAIKLVTELLERSGGELCEGELVGVHVMAFSERLVYSAAGAIDEPSKHAMKCIDELINKKHEAFMNVIYSILGVAEALNDLGKQDAHVRRGFLNDSHALEVIEAIMKIKKEKENG
jgi:hypothetical protein